jgi:Icc-related predicted phosphoesterase
VQGERELRIGAVGDLHYDAENRGALRDLFTAVNREADILVLCGDLTTTGRPEQMEGFAEELAAVQIPVVTVFGNHDHDADAIAEATVILRKRGVHVLDGEHVTLQGVGFVGVKGFAGGFGRATLAPFGEPLIKQFVQHTIEEALKLENALRSLEADTKVVVLHYSPIEATVVGEPPDIFPFLGSSRLLTPLETHGATVVFHGHAHHGTPEGRTPAGIPVFNVALPVLQQHGQSYRIWRVPAPDRRRRAS